MNPYKVLGVSENATQEEIRRAYLELVKKYHPDRYQGTPFENEANEKMKEINEAYDMLTKKQSSTSSSSSQYSSYTGEYASEFSRIEEMIQRNELFMAKQVLDRISFHNARWHYLYGLVSYKLNMHDAAYSHFEMAYRMEPSNYQYRTAYETMSNPRTYTYDYGGYGRRGRASRGDDCSTCDVCTALICADCCCEAMGGDLIPCC